MQQLQVLTDTHSILQIFSILVCGSQQVLEEEPCEGALRLQGAGSHGGLHLQ